MKLSNDTPSGVILFVLAFCLALQVPAYAGAVATSPQESQKHVDDVVAFDKSAPRPSQHYHIAYLTECVDNPYCVARLKGINDAANKFGLSIKVFDAQWSLMNQTKAVQNSVAEHDFDGFIFGPLAAAPSCALWRSTLKPTGKPVVTVTVPMCTDKDYTSGLAATVTMEGPVHYRELADFAFQSCPKVCDAAVLGGFVGSDLQRYWIEAVEDALKKHPNVHLVVNETANFNPRIALQKTQNALLAHKNINLILSNWDDMTRGIEQAVLAAGKRPGKDIQIYSAGATTDILTKIESGEISGSFALLPYEEGYYSTIALLMAMEGHPVNGFVDEAQLPEIEQSSKSAMITSRNVLKYKSKY